MKAYTYTPDGDGKGKEGEIPADLAEAAKAAHEALIEMVAEGDDALMEEFFEKGTLPVEHIIDGLREAVRERAPVPGAVRSALHNIGTDPILNFAGRELPATPPSAARGAAAQWRQGASSARSSDPSPCRYSSSRRSPIPSPAASLISRSSPAS